MLTFLVETMPTTEFKHCYEKDLITNYAPDLEATRRRVRDHDKLLVQSWHQPLVQVDHGVKAEFKQSVTNMRCMQQKKEESVLASILAPIARIFGLS